MTTAMSPEIKSGSQVSLAVRVENEDSLVVLVPFDLNSAALPAATQQTVLNEPVSRENGSVGFVDLNVIFNRRTDPITPPTNSAVVLGSASNSTHAEPLYSRPSGWFGRQWDGLGQACRMFTLYAELGALIGAGSGIIGIGGAIGIASRNAYLAGDSSRSLCLLVGYVPTTLLLIGIFKGAKNMSCKLDGAWSRWSHLN